MGQIIVNGQPYAVEQEDDVLLWVLRDELGLTGTRFGCGIGICGCCTVHVEGVAVRSCTTPVRAVFGKQVTTLEGLATPLPDGTLKLHPVQQAFLDHPLQCCWCVTGHIMTAVALLAQTPNPSPLQIEEVMDGNYCRCGGYNTIRQAVAQAAEHARSSQ
jgi:aerobic-type carbon monoxide dehydrogenase small subunit (CoxS/CutS family)